MDISSIVAGFINSSGYALVAFVAFALVDVIFGVVLAIKQKVFDVNYLPNFLSSSLGIKYGVIVLSAVLANTQSTTSMKDAALAVVTAGSGLMILSLLKDIVSKVQTFFAKPALVAPVKSATTLTGTPTTPIK